MIEALRETATASSRSADSRHCNVGNLRFSFFRIA